MIDQMIFTNTISLPFILKLMRKSALYALNKLLAECIQFYFGTRIQGSQLVKQWLLEVDACL